jgi:hypothetical protein
MLFALLELLMLSLWSFLKMLDEYEQSSPYEGLTPDLWEERTHELVDEHPLASDEIVEGVLGAWSDIFASRIGTRPFRIGSHILPSPQIMAFFLHELIPLRLADMHPGVWRTNESGSEKDLVYIPNDSYSVEIKASSSTRSIFGNRSYAQRGQGSKKSHSGYYLAINFEKFEGTSSAPRITRIRFGWLDHGDWLGQLAATGQQARLSREADRYKLQLLYDVSDYNSFP